MLVVLAVTLLSLGPQPCFKKEPHTPYIVEAYGKLPLAFEPNEGQAGSEADFASRGPGYSLALSAGEAVLALRSPSGTQSLKMRLVGANFTAKPTPEQELPGKSNYFIGNDPLKWRTNVPNYARVRYEQVYPGVDLIYYGNQQQLEYDFVVAPGADPHSIQLAFEGAEKLEVDARGDLVVQTTGSELRMRKPVVYQEADGARHEVAGGYVLKSEQRVGFEVADYDDGTPLVIDPVLVYCTFLFSAGDAANGIALDSSGSAYLVGTRYAESWSAFLVKLNAAGTAVNYTTTLAALSYGRGVAVDAAGNAYITGTADSTGFPTTAGAFQRTCRGAAFVAKLDPRGSLAYSTCLGGKSGKDVGNSIAVDSAGNAYVAGDTYSTDFPTVRPAQGSFGGGTFSDGFATALNAAGSALLYSTYLGGSGEDHGRGIALDPAGNAYIAGTTASPNFPTTRGSFQSVWDGATDAFVTKLSNAGQLIYSTYVSGASAEAIATDSQGSAYIAGTAGTSLVTTSGAFQPGSGGGSDGFVLKLNPSGSAPVYCTYLGGRISDDIHAIAVDGAGNAYVTGYTYSAEFPLVNPFQVGTNGAFGGSFFVAELNPDGSGLVYSTSVLSDGFTEGRGVAVDASGNAYITGTARGKGFPWVNPVQTTGSVFLMKFNGRRAFRLKSVSPSTVVVQAGFTLSVNGTGFAPDCVIQWNGKERTTTFISDTDLQAAVPAAEVTQAGTTWATVYVPGPEGGTSNSASIIVINPAPVMTALSPSTVLAGGPAFVLTISGAGFIPQSFVSWNGTTRATTFLNANTLQVSLPPADIAVGGTASVAIWNPPPGGGASNTLTFVISGNPGPSITSVAPSRVTAGSPGFTLTVNGRNFVSSSVVKWNGTDRPTAFVNASQLQASIPASDVAASGTARVNVFSPTPGGGNSSSVTFTIDAVPSPSNPVPTLGSLQPSSATQGGSAFTLSVVGTNFIQGSVVRWNGADRATTLVSNTLTQASIPATDLAAAGTALVAVFNPAPGGGLSNSLPFTIWPPPVVNTGGVVNGASFGAQVAAGSIASVFGTGLAPTIQAADKLPLPTTLGGISVSVNGFAAPLFYVSPLQINFQVPWEAGVVAQPVSTVTVTVNGVASAPQTFSLAGIAPGLFAVNPAGQGAVLISATGELAAPAGSIAGRAARPAKRGEYVSIYCTGMGAVSNQPANGAAAASSPSSITPTDPTVTIGGMPAPVTFSGLAPSFVGLYQVNVQVPDSAAPGSAVPVVLTISGATSNTVTIAVQ